MNRPMPPSMMAITSPRRFDGVANPRVLSDEPLAISARTASGEAPVPQYTAANPAITSVYHA